MGNIYKILSSFVPFLPQDFTSCVIFDDTTVHFFLRNCTASHVGWEQGGDDAKFQTSSRVIYHELLVTTTH